MTSLKVSADLMMLVAFIHQIVGRKPTEESLLSTSGPEQNGARAEVGSPAEEASREAVARVIGKDTDTTDEADLRTQIRDTGEEVLRAATSSISSTRCNVNPSRSSPPERQETSQGETPALDHGSLPAASANAASARKAPASDVLSESSGDEPDDLPDSMMGIMAYRTRSPRALVPKLATCVLEMPTKSRNPDA